MLQISELLLYLAFKFSTSLLPVLKQMSLKAAIYDQQLAACLGEKSRLLELQQCLDAAHLGLCACHCLKIPKVTAESENCMMMQRRFS